MFDIKNSKNFFCIAKLFRNGGISIELLLTIASIMFIYEMHIANAHFHYNMFSSFFYFVNFFNYGSNSQNMKNTTTRAMYIDLIYI